MDGPHGKTDDWSTFVIGAGRKTSREHRSQASGGCVMMSPCSRRVETCGQRVIQLSASCQPLPTPPLRLRSASLYSVCFSTRVVGGWLSGCFGLLFLASVLFHVPFPAVPNSCGICRLIFWFTMPVILPLSVGVTDMRGRYTRGCWVNSDLKCSGIGALFLNASRSSALFLWISKQ